MRSQRQSLLLTLVLPVAMAMAACGGALDGVPAGAAADSQAATAARLPADYVLTPNGAYHRSCVHALGDAATFDVSGRVSFADGSSATLPDCAYPRLALSSLAATTNGWVEAANWTSPTPAVKMTSTFTVPAAPASKGGQTVFFFPGMEPSDGTIILQPVLQWGPSAAGGGPDWGFASWSCGPSCVHSTLIPVKAGDSLSGAISGSGCSTKGQCSWQIVSKDTTTGKASTLNTRGDTKSYVWLFGGALEGYSLTACAQYPASRKESFGNVNFYDGTGKLLAPAFKNSVFGTQPSCAFSVTSTAHTTTLNF